jgi:replicative DNA helicase
MTGHETPMLPPHDLDAEQAVLSAVVLDPPALSRAQKELTAEDFYHGRHRRIFEAMADLSGRSAGIDLVTLGDELESKGELKRIGGRGALAELVTTVGSAANIEHHARIVRDCAIRRRVIRFAATLTQQAYEKAPADELVQQAERELFQMASGRDERHWCPLSEVSTETVDYVDHMSKRKDALVGIPTGYQSLNDMLGGYQRSDLIIMAARTSMGKTSLALGSALAAAMDGHRVGFFSLEMSRRQLGLRLHGTGAPIDVHALKTGSLSPQGWFHFAHAAQQLSALPFWIDDSSVLTVEQLAAKARHLQAMHGLDLLVVDYLQLLHLSRAENRQQGIADVSRKLKLLAKELDIPVIVLSQLSRECEKRADQRPMLSDLRDSGAIEQDADVVLFIYRDEVYNPNSEDKGIAEILIRKHRNGPVGVRRLVFIERYAKFCELDSAS